MLALHVTTLCCRRESFRYFKEGFTEENFRTFKEGFKEENLRNFKEGFTQEKLRLRKSFTLRQTPHMSLPTPQVPPPCTDVPQPDPPVFRIQLFLNSVSQSLLSGDSLAYLLEGVA